MLNGKVTNPFTGFCEKSAAPPPKDGGIGQYEIILKVMAISNMYRSNDTYYEFIILFNF